MNKQKKTQPKPQVRAHRVLWDRDLPFRARTEPSATQYQLHSKHRNRDLAW